MIKNQSFVFLGVMKTPQGPYNLHTRDQPTELAGVGCSGKCVGSNTKRRLSNIARGTDNQTTGLNPRVLTRDASPRDGLLKLNPLSTTLNFSHSFISPDCYS